MSSGLYPGFGELYPRVWGWILVWGRCPGLTPPSRLFPVLLTGGIVAVAGQFKGWYFAAYSMYPSRQHSRGWAAGKPRPGRAERHEQPGGHILISPRCSQLCFPRPAQPIFGVRVVLCLGLFLLPSRFSLTPRQRCRCPGVPAGVSQEQEEKGLHHGEVVSAVPPLVPPKHGAVGGELGLRWGSPEGGCSPRVGTPRVTPCCHPAVARST